MLNKQTGNMYPWINATWNPVQGACPHQCSYCYGERIWRLAGLGKGQVLKETYLEDDLYAPIKEKGAPHTIFVCSTTDMWISEPAWIKRVLNHCRDYPNNTYLFQSKAPEEMKGWIFPPHTILGTTLETDGKIAGYSRAPEPAERALALTYLKKLGYRTMVSIEPIMDFYLPTLVMYISMIEPDFVSIGADSKNHHLPEPNPIQVRFLIKELAKFTEVRVKPNLKRIMGNEVHDD